MTEKILTTVKGNHCTLLDVVSEKGKSVHRLIPDEGVPIAVETGFVHKDGKVYYGVALGHAITREETRMTTPHIMGATKPLNPTIFILHLLAPPGNEVLGDPFMSFLNVGLVEQGNISLPCGVDGVVYSLPLFRYSNDFTVRDYARQTSHKRSNSWFTQPHKDGLTKSEFTFGIPGVSNAGMVLPAIGA